MAKAGALILLLIAVPCLVSLPWSVQKQRYDNQRLKPEFRNRPPGVNYVEVENEQGDTETMRLVHPLGTDRVGRELVWRCLLGGAISLGVGAAAATIAVGIGVAWGALAGYLGGRVDAVMMRIVDVLYGLPYILLVVLVKIALQPAIESLLMWMHMSASSASGAAAVISLLIAIGGVSWLTMARVIRGQVLSLRDQPFVEAARATGVPTGRILRVHLLPNLVGPIIVYATLTVPQAILQESFLSFLGIGVQPPLPSWGNLASAGLTELHTLASSGIRDSAWWLLFFPCLLLGLTLLALNLLGDALRERWDPKAVRGLRR